MYLSSAEPNRSPGNPNARIPSPVIVSAASIALTTASSVASIVAANSGSIRSLGSMTSVGVPVAAAAPGFADQIGDRLGKPTVQKWYAWMLLRRAATGDRDQARALLDEAIISCRGMGMQLSLGEAEAMRRSLDG